LEGSRVPRPRQSWSVYILRCHDGSLYTGATNDLGRRLERHAAGKGARYTRSRLPVRLVYEEHAKNQGAALRREVALKRLTRAQKLVLVAAGKVTRRQHLERTRRHLARHRDAEGRALHPSGFGGSRCVTGLARVHREDGSVLGHPPWTF
jgi:putative endonuclease